jgi:uncharacterized membrane protein
VTTRPPSRPTTPPAPPRISPLPFAGMIGLTCVLFVDLASSIVVPWWLVVALVVVWLMLFVIACAWWTPHPRRLPWLAGVGVGAWLAVLIGWSMSSR